MRKLFLWISAVSLLASCESWEGSDGGPKDSVTKISFGFDIKGRYAVQMRDGNGKMMSIDTLEIVGFDEFTISFDTIRTLSFVPLDGDLPVVHAVIGPSTKVLQIDQAGFISGDAENNWLGEQRRMQHELMALSDSLDRIKSTYSDSSTFKGLNILDTIFFQYADSYRQRVLDSLELSPNKISNLLTIYHRIGQSPVLDYMYDRDVLRNMQGVLLEQYPNSPDVKAFDRWMYEFEERYQFTLKVQEAAQKFQPGHPFPELRLETPEGNEVIIQKNGLNDHVVAIWASWCPTCRNELAGMSQTASMENWLCLSIDGLPEQRSPLADWYNAIQSENLKGTHLSDLRGAESSIITGLGIQNLPVYFRVKDGVIIQRVSSVADLN
jgi:thiol-disulfide isomerase/thioredoxin